jgi:hypothetical protein
VGLLIGVLPILGYTLQFGAKQRVGVFSFSVAVALAAGLVGCFLGFLFAIPRFDITDRDLQDVGKYGRAGWLHNTNLSQISDWLTKILVGVGLTQFRSIGDAIGNLLIQLSPGLGGLDSSAAFGGLLISYFATMGFSQATFSLRFIYAAPSPNKTKTTSGRSWKSDNPNCRKPPSGAPGMHFSSR